MEAPDQPIRKLTSLAAKLPLLWISLAFLLGIIVASQVHASTRLWLILAGVGLVSAVTMGILAVRYKLLPLNLFLIALAMMVFFLGAGRFQTTVPEITANHISWYNDREYEILVTGNVAGFPDERDTYTNLRVEVTSVDTGDEELPVIGLILARVSSAETYHYGDVVRLRGHLKTPPENEDFSYRDYLARQGIRAIMSDAAATRLPFISGNPFLRLVFTFKEHAIANIYRIFPDPEASLLAGILLGEDKGLSAGLQQAFNNTGTAHIIAISGFNIAIIAALFVTVFSRLFGLRRGAVAACVGIAVYTVLVGAEASVVRAAIMGGLALFARQVGRRQFAINTLAFTAAVMGGINPNTLWEAGFQLSFAATLGLVLYAAPFQDWLTNQLVRHVPVEIARKIAGLVGAFILFTLAAQLTTLPIIAYHFGAISLVSFLANPFILPAQPLVMIMGGLAVLLSFVYLPLGQIAAWVSWPFTAYTIRAVEAFNLLPHGVILLGDFSFLFVLLFYTVLLSLTYAWPRVKKTFHTALAPSGILVVLGVLAYLAWSAAFTVPDGRLHLTFLNVGSADAVLIQTPDGRFVLVNGGESPAHLSAFLGRRLPPFNRSLDWLVVASTQEQQISALPRILDRIPATNTLWAGLTESSYSAGLLDRWLSDHGIPVARAYPGAMLDLGRQAKLEVLSISPRGAVVVVKWKSFLVLLPIGMNFDTLTELEYGKSIGPVTVLLLADSGYGQTNPPEWLSNLHPQVAILSVVAGDPDGLPSQSVLDQLKDITLLRTDRNGWIEVTTDGEQMWLTEERK